VGRAEINEQSESPDRHRIQRAVDNGCEEHGEHGERDFSIRRNSNRLPFGHKRYRRQHRQLPHGPLQTYTREQKARR
jgi:hypothetical protein